MVAEEKAARGIREQLVSDVDVLENLQGKGDWSPLTSHMQYFLRQLWFQAKNMTNMIWLLEPLRWGLASRKSFVKLICKSYFQGLFYNSQFVPIRRMICHLVLHRHGLVLNALWLMMAPPLFVPPAAPPWRRQGSQTASVTARPRGADPTR